MLKIVIAPDKFKGSLTSLEFCKIVAETLQGELPEIEIVQLPLADGGDGTAKIFSYYLHAEEVVIEVHDPLFRKIKASYFYSSEKQSAYIEMAAASGLHLLNKAEQNPMQTSTFGTGELIKDALEKGAKKIFIGIGGSATNDAGMGMASALGYRFYDSHDNLLTGIGNDLQKLHRIEKHNIHPYLSDTSFTIACDVASPLFGSDGAAQIFAPQKGANEIMVKELDKGLQHFNEIIKKNFDCDISKLKGAGAAGGLGAGAVIFLNGDLSSGIEILKTQAKFQEKIKLADWVITGEGALDFQTFQGKVIKGVIDEITSQKLAIFCGQNKLAKNFLASYPIHYLNEIRHYASSYDDAIQNSSVYLRKITKDFINTQLKTKSK